MSAELPETKELVVGEIKVIKTKDSDTLNASRVKKLEKANQELLEKLCDAKRKKKRRRKEFEVEANDLRRRIDDLEATKLELLETVNRLSGNGILLKDQLEGEFERLRDDLEYSKRRLNDADEREQNLREQLEIVKMNLKDKENVKKELEAEKEKTSHLKELSEATILENTKLHDDLEESLRLLDQARRENNSLRLLSNDSNELEKDFRLQKRLMLNFLDGETSKATKAAAETLAVKESARANEDCLKDDLLRTQALLEEKEEELENESLEKWTIHETMEEQKRNFVEKEIELRSKIEELTEMMIENRRQLEEAEHKRTEELKAETERLDAILKVKDKEHEEEIVGRAVEHQLEITKLKEEWKTRMEELEDKLIQENSKHGDQLKALLADNKRMAEELGRSTRQCSDLELELEKLRAEVDKVRRQATLLSDEDRIGKLERALVRLKLENDQLRSSTDQKGTKELMREKESHIIDLQREVSALRDTVKRYQVEKSTLGKREGTDEKYGEMFLAHRKLLDETTRLKNALETGGHDPTLIVELVEAKKKVNQSSIRISQLEKWLDEIYSTDLDVGGLGALKSRGGETYRTTGVVLPELKIRSNVANRLSKPKTK